MFYIVRITKWESRIDGKKRVGAMDGSAGRPFLINTDKISNLTAGSNNTSRFYYTENPNDQRVNWDYIESTTSVAELITASDIPYSTNYVTLPVYKDNDITKPTTDMTINVFQFIYADVYNPAPNDACWVVYLQGGAKRIKILVALTFNEILALFGGVPVPEPVAVSAVEQGDGHILVTWIDNSVAGDGSQVWASEDGDDFSLLATVGAGVTTYEDTAYTGITMRYKIKSFEDSVYSSFSNIVSATVWAPQTLVVEASTPTEVVMTGSIANTGAVAANFTIAGFTVSSLSRDITNKILTLTLTTSVVYTDSISVVYKGNSYAITNNTIPTFYVKNGGNDALNGLTDATAWETVSKVNATTFVAGDQILFKKGGTWREQLNPRGSGSASEPIIYSSYGAGADPIISGSNVITGFAHTGANQWDVALATDPLLVMVGATRGTRVTNKAAVVAANQWTWITGTLTVYSVGDPSGTIQAGARQKCIDTYVNLSQNLLFRDMTFEGCRDGTLAYIRHTTVTGINFLNCTIRNSGGEGLYFVSTVGALSNCSVRSCDIYGIWRNGIFSDPNLTPDANHEMTVDLCNVYNNGLQTSTDYNGIMGNLAGWWITNCDIYNNGRYNILSHGIYSYGVGTGGSALFVHVDNCLLHDQPNGSGLRTRTSLIATNNRSYGNLSGGINIGTTGTANVVIHLGNNLVYDNTQWGILAAGPGTGTFKLRMYHNTILHAGSEALIQITRACLELIMRDNILNCQSAEYVFEDISAGPSAWDINYNSYFRADDGNKFKWANVLKTFAQWQGVGIVNDANGYYGDPVLTDISDPSYDLHLTAGSPAAVRAGGIAVAGYDYDIDSAAYSNPPSMGAYQY